MDYTRRFYRDFSPSTRWESYRVQVETSDLYIRAKDRCPLRVQARVRELGIDFSQGEYFSMPVPEPDDQAGR